MRTRKDSLTPMIRAALTLAIALAFLGTSPATSVAAPQVVTAHVTTVVPTGDGFLFYMDGNVLAGCKYNVAYVSTSSGHSQSYIDRVFSMVLAAMHAKTKIQVTVDKTARSDKRCYASGLRGHR